MITGIIEIIYIKAKKFLADGFSEFKLKRDKADYECYDERHNSSHKALLYEVKILHDSRGNSIKDGSLKAYKCYSGMQVL
jgi:hypothetical protein